MEPFIGQIMLCGLPFAPRGWSDCSGQLLPIRQNTALFSLLGTTYGGDGVSNFALPNLQGRVAVGNGQRPGGQPYALGAMAGAETATITTATMAPHGHGMSGAGTSNGTASPLGNSFATLPGGRGSGGHMYAPPPADTTLGSVVQAQGGGNGHPNIQPYLALRYVIALQGVFPQRP